STPTSPATWQRRTRVTGSAMPERAFVAVQRAALAALADVLIPAVDGMPAAADAGATGKWLDRAVTARPELVAPLERIASLPGEDDPRASLERLIAEDAEGFAALTAAVSGAYYMNLKIRKRIGYPRPEDHPCETGESNVEPVMFNAVGGSTIHYGAQWARMRPADFRVRTLEGVADDWPISYEDLLAHYDRMAHEMNVSGIGGDPAY